jgi:hypothetical protein
MPTAEQGQGLGRQGGRGAAWQGAPPTSPVLGQGMRVGEHLRSVVNEQKLHRRLPCVHVSAPGLVWSPRAGPIRGVQANKVRDATPDTEPFGDLRSPAKPRTPRSVRPTRGVWSHAQARARPPYPQVSGRPRSNYDGRATTRGHPSGYARGTFETATDGGTLWARIPRLATRRWGALIRAGPPCPALRTGVPG